MKLQYLGTAAAEGFPALFCTCDTCRRAQKAGGKNIRSRSQAVVDNKLLIDFPADTYLHILAHGLSLPDIHYCFITHKHSDHFYISDLEMRALSYAKLTDGLPLHLYGMRAVYDEICGLVNRIGAGIKERVVPHLLEKYAPVFIDGYTVIPLPADHDPDSEPVIYLIENEKSSLLYAHDTGVWGDDVWKYLADRGRTIDFVSLDCTAGLLHGWTHSHLSLDVCADVKKRMLAERLADAHTRFCLNHFSHNCLATYDEMLLPAKQAGFEVSFDGMCADF